MTYEERNQRDAEEQLVNPDEVEKPKRKTLENDYSDDFEGQ